MYSIEYDGVLGKYIVWKREGSALFQCYANIDINKCIKYRKRVDKDEKLK